MQDWEKRYLYFDIPKEERDSAIAFLLEAIAKSRLASGFSASQHEFDEDVNIYLAHLLFASSLPDYQEAVRRYVSMKVSEVVDLLENTDDRVVRYFIYKVNADYLLVHLGVFNYSEHARDLFGKSERQYSSMAQGYYEQAAQYHKRIYRRQTAIGAVLEKLARFFDEYKTVLRWVRKDYFHFSNQFPDQSFRKFCEDISHYEKEQRLNELVDRFLDSYAEWLRTHDQNAWLIVIKVAEEIKELDPKFSFDQNGGQRIC